MTLDDPEKEGGLVKSNIATFLKLKIGRNRTSNVLLIISLYIVVLPITTGLQISIDIQSILSATKPVVSPTYQRFSRSSGTCDIIILKLHFATSTHC